MSWWYQASWCHREAGFGLGVKGHSTGASLEEGNDKGPILPKHSSRLMGVYRLLFGVLLFLVCTRPISCHNSVPVAMQVAQHLSDLGNQHNNTNGSNYSQFLFSLFGLGEGNGWFGSRMEWCTKIYSLWREWDFFHHEVVPPLPQTVFFQT